MHLYGWNRRKNQKVKKSRVSLDLSVNDMNRVKRLERLYDMESHAEVARSAIRHDVVLAEFVKAGGKIQHLKKDGTVETIVFTEWMPFCVEDAVK